MCFFVRYVEFGVEKYIRYCYNLYVQYALHPVRISYGVAELDCLRLCLWWFILERQLAGLTRNGLAIRV